MTSDELNNYELVPLYKLTATGKVLVWRIRVKDNKDNTASIIRKFGYVDGAIQRTEDIVRSGKNIGKRNETTPYTQALSEAVAEHKEKLTRKGYGLTVEASADSRKISPMLAMSLEKVKAVDWSHAFGQPKLDGFRMLAIKLDSELLLRSREHKPISTMSHIYDELSSVMQAGHILDGELYCHGMPFQQIASAVKRRSNLSERVKFHVFDMISDDEFSTRYSQAKELVRGLEHVVIVDTVRLKNRDDLTTVQHSFISQGYEGAMLRYGTSGYETGKRSRYLVKVKEFKDAEFVVIDAKEGRGIYAGMAIFVCETNKGAVFEVTAPGSHDEKKAYWKDREKYIRKKLTVKYFELTTTPSGRVPRFPVALRFKDSV